MGFDDWIRALHLLSAFELVGAITMFSIMFVVLRSGDTPNGVLALGSAMKVGPGLGVDRDRRHDRLRRHWLSR